MADRIVAALLVLACLLGTGAAGAKDAEPVAAASALEARVMALATELRCLVCQNQTLADSHADLAVDLRRQIRDMLARGASEDDVRRYMTERYGDFVLYKPPFKASTAALWGGPPVLLAAALAGLFAMLRKRQNTRADAFDPDTADDDPRFPAAR